MPSLVSQHTCCALRVHTLAAPSASLPTTNQPFAGLEALSAYCVLTAPIHQPSLPKAAALHPLSLEVSPTSLTSSSTIPHRDLGSNACTKGPILSGHPWILLDLVKLPAASCHSQRATQPVLIASRNGPQFVSICSYPLSGFWYTSLQLLWPPRQLQTWTKYHPLSGSPTVTRLAP
jgi:hypothetical protein